MGPHIAVIGGGPAGMATAISLVHTDPSLRVMVFERSEYDQLRIGETLPPTIEPLLRRLGVWNSFIEANHQPAYRSLSAWGSSQLLANEFIEHPYNRGWHLDRRRFDCMLAEAASQNGVDVRTTSSVTRIDFDPNKGWRIYCSSEEGESIIETEFVVDATGRHADVAVSQGAKRVFYDRMIALVSFYKDDPGADTSTVIETCEYGWWYSSSLPGNDRIVACFTDNDVVARMKLKSPDRWTEQLSCLPHISTTVAGVTQPMRGPILFSANSSKLDRCVGDSWLAVGDAATTFDPLSSQGVFKAIRSGVLASYAICDYFSGREVGLERYQLLVRKEFESYLQTRADFYSGEQRWPMSPFWRRRQPQLTLSPLMELLRTNSTNIGSMERYPMNLIPPDLEAICSLCSAPTPAHEVITSFRARTHSKVSDQHVIVALQQLIDQGFLTSNAPHLHIDNR